MNFVRILFRVMLDIYVSLRCIYLEFIAPQIFLGKGNVVTFFRRERRALYVVIEQTTICT